MTDFKHKYIEKIDKIKCQCPEVGSVRLEEEYWYSKDEKSGMNHKAGECKGTNEIRLYIRGGKRLYLCSCCVLFGDRPVSYE